MATFKYLVQSISDGVMIRRKAWPIGEYYTAGSDVLVTNKGRSINEKEMEFSDWLEIAAPKSVAVGANYQKTQFAEDMHQDLKRMCDMLSIAMQKKGFSIESKPDGSDAYIVYKKGPFINVVQALMSLLEDQDII